MPTLNSARLIPEVVKRVKGHLRPKRIIIVDGGSRDDTQAIARGLGCEVLIDTRSLGSSRMTGVKACTSEIVCFIDDDIYVGEGFSEKMLGYLDGKTGAVQAIPLLNHPTIGERSRRISEERFAGRPFIELKRNERGYTNATLLRKDLIADLDISDLDAYEDLVIARHIIDKGFSWKVVPVYVQHDHRGRQTVRKSAWNYAGVLNLSRTGRLSLSEALKLFARFAYSHPVEMADALRASDRERFAMQARLLLGAALSPLYPLITRRKRM
jgi:glycosyltransferase involved in cell wall biosynthesis